MHRARFAIVLLPALALHPAARADSLIVPGAGNGAEGNEGNVFPFSPSTNGIPSQRYQQVYGASAFASLPGPITITDILFRPDATLPGAPFSNTLPSIQINLSTTAAAVDALSLTFANNLGANDAVVFSGALSLSSAYTGPAAGPKDFDIAIHLQTPFTYNPAAGNLLLDVRNFSSVDIGRFDLINDSTDSVSRVYTSTGGTANDPTAAFAATEGLVTQFNFRPAALTNPTPLPAAAWAATPLLALLLAAAARPHRPRHPN